MSLMRPIVSVISEREAAVSLAECGWPYRRHPGVWVWLR